jgi:hypothetical protein
MPCEELDIVWNNIKAEARALADCEPMLASFYHATLLKHENLGSALSYMLANKLASSIMPAIAIREVVEEAYAADPEMIASAACDIQAVRTRDPAVDKYSTPLLYLKGFHAFRLTASATGCGTKAAARWPSSCKTRFRHLPGGYSPGRENWPWDHARPRHRHCGR